MDVDKYNCSVVFDDFKVSIEQCDFYALDQEMTGVDNGERPQSGTMSLTELYQVSRDVVNRYIAFQLGVTVFKRVDGGYEVKPYNFYLLKSVGDFVVNIESLKFLADNHMDFQRWLVTGMPYCGKVDTGLRGDEGGSVSSLRRGLSEYLVSRIKKWYNSPLARDGECITFKTVICEEIERLTLSKLKEEQVFVSFEYDKSRCIGSPVSLTVHRGTSHFASGQGKEKATPDLEPIKVCGFQHFWKCLTDCKKPIVGHNFWLDIMFMVQMHEGPLPEDYDTYKRLVHQLFPCVYDTKTLGREVIINNLSESFCLKDLYDRCLASRLKLGGAPEFFFPPGFGRYDPDSLESECKAHEAGYDSYMTGVAFSICRDLYCSGENSTLDKWRNIVSVYGSNYYMNVNGKDSLRRSATFVVEFREEIEYPFGELLLCRDDAFTNVDRDVELLPRDCIISYDNKGLCRTIIVVFEDDISEDEVQTRIANSARRWSEVTKEANAYNIVFPEILSVYRLSG
ncbi:ribonuclease, putative [Trypanosoma brucei brucei TREU927]|uniref:Ribonuclease, putative n=1 Tax=Trypanosoma brucei brucei (strain 927/4 GUTat10.1) TaxID=185431 RepID=Q38AC8_TRYB2|nr:ribonuclease, putative [Trypanosoma brucei brucei TREU927]EAN78242.1 ribonuclease, putative [Trypanosoma brucei brucei TREU927]